MALGTSRWLRPSLIGSLWRDVRLAWRLLREPRVSLATKAIVPLALLYVVSPIDLLPDFLVGIGEIDDLLVLYGALRLFLFLCPRSSTAFHRAAVATGQPFRPVPPSEVVIDAEFRRDA